MASQRCITLGGVGGEIADLISSTKNLKLSKIISRLLIAAAEEKLFSIAAEELNSNELNIFKTNLSSLVTYTNHTVSNAEPSNIATVEEEHNEKTKTNEIPSPSMVSIDEAFTK